jgi:hypothetical protein
MQAERPEGPALSRQRPPLPARAMPAQVKLASPVDPVYPVRRAGRGPAPITCLIHLPPPAVRCRVQVRQLHILITHHVNLVSRPGRSCGHRVPPPGPELACGAGRHHRAWVTADSADSADSRAGHTTRAPSACPPPLIQSRRFPARYRPGPRCAARDQRQRETLPSAPCPAD